MTSSQWPPLLRQCRKKNGLADAPEYVRGLALHREAWLSFRDTKEADAMTTTTFDSLGYFQKLKAAGVPEEQAQVQADAFREFTAIQEENARKELATKMDIVQAEMSIKTELVERIENSKHEVLKWTITTVVAQTALIVAVIAFLK